MSKRYWLLFIVLVMIIVPTSIFLYLKISKNDKSTTQSILNDSSATSTSSEIVKNYKDIFVEHGINEENKLQLSKVFDEVSDNEKDKNVAFFLEDKLGYFHNKKNIYWYENNTSNYSKIRCDLEEAKVMDENNFDILLCGKEVFINGVLNTKYDGLTLTALAPNYIGDKDNTYFRDIFLNTISGNYEIDTSLIEGNPTEIHEISNMELPNNYVEANGKLYFKANQYPKIDLNSFKKVYGRYYADKSYYYYLSDDGPKLITNVSKLSPYNFSDDTLTSYVSIGSNVYLGEVKLTGANLSNLKAFDAESVVGGVSTLTPCVSRCNYVWDGKNVYYKGLKLSNVDAPSFRLIGYGTLIGTSPYSSQPKYAADKNKIYFENKTLSGVNKDSFEVFGEANYHLSYAKDNKNVYFEDKIISNANNDTFTPIPSVYRPSCSISDYSKDDTNIFFKANRINRVDYDSFEYIPAINGVYGKDKNNYFRGGDDIENNNLIPCK